jgi:ABC-2 type transport system ATP-binding protein
MKIRLHNVTKHFGNTIALAHVPATIEPGQIIAVVGLNGAGKTTLLRIMATLLRVNKGEGYYDDQALRRSAVDLRRKLVSMPDLLPVFPV